jgi:hypothetical protein
MAAGQSYLDGDRPEASWKLGADNFVKQGRTILVQLGEKVGVVRRDPLRPPFCLGLVLSNEAVKEAEVRRESDGGRVDAHPVSRGLYDIGCFFLVRMLPAGVAAWFFHHVHRRGVAAFVLSAASSSRKCA